MRIKNIVVLTVAFMVAVGTAYAKKEAKNKGGPVKDAKEAVIETPMGKIVFEFLPKVAPKTVENFKKLAADKFYDGTTFHRVIPGFMIQGGDPKGNGSGDPGFVIPDEVWIGAHHDQRGLICMANRGPNTNGSQFFIMDGVAAHLDSGYTIFGKCSPDSVIQAIAASKTQGDRAIDAPKIQTVTVKRVK